MTDFSLRKRPKKSIDRKVILKDEDLRRRTRWAINYAADVHDLTNETMAPLIDSKIGTVANYRAMATSPKADFISNFCKKFDFSEVWFLKGKGEPFPGARAKYDAVCGPEPFQPPTAGGADSALPVKERAVHYCSGPEFSIYEDLTLAAKVLESRTHYATALHLNIRGFAGAVDDVIALKQMNGVLARLQEVESKLELLQVENKTLRTEVNRLKATYEDPGEGSGHRTNTSA